MKRGLLSKIFLLALVGIVAIAFVGCSANNSKNGAETSTVDKIKADKVIIMGTNAEFPPFEYRNDNGEVDGFDVAMAQEIAKELGVELKVEDMAFDSLLQALQSGKVDFVAAGMTVKPERLENADFSTPYYKATQFIIVNKDNDTIKTKDDLKGKKIGVQEGTTGDYEASDIEGTTVSRFKKGIDAVMDLNNGKVDAVIIDSNPAKVFASKFDNLKILDSQFTDEDYAIAVKKGDKELVEVINKVIKDIADNGKYDEFIKEYIED